MMTMLAYSKTTTRTKKMMTRMKKKMKRYLKIVHEPLLI